jgi:hypothetical protein
MAEKEKGNTKYSLRNEWIYKFLADRLAEYSSELFGTDDRPGTLTEEEERIVDEASQCAANRVFEDNYPGEFFTLRGIQYIAVPIRPENAEAETYEGGIEVEYIPYKEFVKIVTTAMKDVEIRWERDRESEP